MTIEELNSLLAKATQSYNKKRRNKEYGVPQRVPVEHWERIVDTLKRWKSWGIYHDKTREDLQWKYRE